MADGMGCTCAAWSENECCCGADWTTQEIYDLREQLAASQKREVMLRDVLTKISNRFDYGPTYGSIEWTTLNDAVNAITATEAALKE